MGHRVQAITIQSPVQPKAQAALVVGQHSRIPEIEVRHMRAKGAKEGTLPGLCPGVLAPNIPAGGRCIFPHIPVVERAARAGLGANKHRVFSGAVVDDVIHDDADTALVSLRNQFIKISQRAVGGVDATKVRGGVAVVAISIGGDRHQPDAGNAQVFEIVQGLGHAFQVANAIAIAVLVGAHKDFHESTMLPAHRQLTWHPADFYGTDVNGGVCSGRLGGSDGKCPQHQSRTHCRAHKGPKDRANREAVRQKRLHAQNLNCSKTTNINLAI